MIVRRPSHHRSRFVRLFGQIVWIWFLILFWLYFVYWTGIKSQIDRIDFFSNFWIELSRIKFLLNSNVKLSGNLYKVTITLSFGWYWNHTRSQLSTSLFARWFVFNVCSPIYCGQHSICFHLQPRHLDTNNLNTRIVYSHDYRSGLQSRLIIVLLQSQRIDSDK